MSGTTNRDGERGRRPRVLLVHTRVVPHGGGQAVAAWTIQALQDVAELTVLSWTPPDLAGLDRLFGTEVAAAEVRCEWAPRPVARLVDGSPLPARLLRRAVLQRHCRALDRRHRYDVLVSTDNELDFGRRGVQYVHCPDVLGLSLRERGEWYDRIPGLVPAYQAFCAALAGWSAERVRGNATLANSEFTRQLLRRVYGVESTTLYPPVPGGFPEVPWEERAPACVFIGLFISSW